MLLACPVLINTITSMVLISIHPFALRKLLFVVVAFLCLSAFCFADPVLMVRRYSTHPPRLGWVVSAPAWQEPQAAWLAKSELDVRESNDLRHEQITREFTQGDAPGVIRTAPSLIFGKPVCAMRPIGPHAGLLAAPPRPAPGEI